MENSKINIRRYFSEKYTIMFQLFENKCWKIKNEINNITYVLSCGKEILLSFSSSINIVE